MNEKIKLKNRKVRNILLISTIMCFVVFIIMFVTSTVQYQNVQEKIENVYTMLNEDKNNYNEILTNYNEAEYYFRLFTIDFDDENFQQYKLKLGYISTFIDSVLLDTQTDSAHLYSYQLGLGQRSKAVENFVAIKQRISYILDYSNNLQDLSSTGSSELEATLPEPRNTSSDETTVSTNNNFIVIEKKPLLKRIFSNKKDTIRFDQIETIKKHTEQVYLDQREKISQINQNTSEKFADLKQSFSQLRKTERELLSTNFSLLYQLSDIIKDLESTHIREAQQQTNSEISSLIAVAKIFKWQIIFGSFFMFVTICILIYYQFFTSYYQQKLVEERTYASTVAEEKTNILAEITHEIRTPINSLLGIIDLLRRKEEVYDKTELQLLDTVFSDVQYTSKTIDDILNLSKIDQHSESLEAEFNIRNLIHSVIDIHQNQANLKNIKLEHHIAPSMPTIVYSNEFRINQILTNLLSNAIKYSKFGTIECFVKIKEDNMLVLKVKDQGIGIDQDARDSIFDKYYTVNKNHKTDGGVGLGLYITKKLVTSLNGTISFTSELQQGSTFTVEIPIPTARHHVEETTVADLKDLSNKLSWLIVDDNALNILYMRQFFKQNSNIFSATNGLEAIEIIEHHPIDVVITDINMPIMTGDELLLSIRNNPAWKHIRVIATSSDNEQMSHLERKHNTKFDNVLVKPFNEKKFFDAIAITIQDLGIKFDASKEK